MKKFFSLMIILIITSFIVGCGNDKNNNSEDFMTPEQFQKKYNDNLMLYIKKYNNNNNNIKNAYDNFSIKNIEYIKAEEDGRGKAIDILFKTNERSITIKTFSPNGVKELRNVNVFLDKNVKKSEHWNYYWQSYCEMAVVIAHSFNNKSNINETENIIRNLLQQFDNGNLSPSIDVDGINYAILGGNFAFSKIVNQNKQESKVGKSKVNQSNQTTSKIDEKEIYCGTSYLGNGQPDIHYYLVVDSVSGNKRKFQCKVKFVYVRYDNSSSYMGFVFETTNNGINYYTSPGGFGTIKSEQEFVYWVYLKALDYLK